MKLNETPASTDSRRPSAGLGDVASAYVSPLILRAAYERPDAEVPWIEEVSGTLLMADISGFTAMSERLAEAGREGAEMLTGIINRYFTAMIDAASANGGHNLKFGGDALLLYFDGQGHAERAGLTALAMQRENKRQAGLRIGGERHKPSVSIGLHSGHFWSVAVGEPGTRLQHVIFGDDVNRVVDAEGEANAGEVVATSETAGDAWETEPRREFKVVKSVPARGGAPDSLSLVAVPAGVDLEGYLPPPVLWALRGQGSASLGEHRGVVVSFIHATGLESIARSDGEAEALRQLQEYTSELIHLLERYGGFLVSNDIYFEGVKFIVVFGAPIAREDDPANAMRFAIALESWLEESGLALKHRIGINGGNAFAGDIGAPYRREYTVMGDCVNLSARLMSAAERGQIIVSDTTAARAGGGFLWRGLEPIHVKGKSDEIAIRQLLDLDSAGAVPSVDQRTPFVGRARELDRLRSICLQVEEAAGQSLVLMGEAGAGKSRLLLETVQYARARGWSVHQARCFAHSAGSPYTPWAGILRSLLGIEGDTAPAERTRLAGERLGVLCPELVPLAPLLNPILELQIPGTEAVDALDEEARGQRLQELMSTIVTRSAADSPMLVTIDDAHNSDESSIELARRVHHDAKGSRVLLALAERAPGRRIFAARSRATVLNIGPLDGEESERLATLALGRNAATARVLGVLLQRSRGNPLFIEEVARSLRESPDLMEQLTGDAGEGPGVEGLVPDRLQNLLMSRIDRLEPALRDVVKVAAVVGSGIEADTVAVGLARMGTQLDAGTGLDRLVAEGVLQRDVPGGPCYFSHGLFQEVAYGNLAFGVRRGIHGGIAREIESSRRDLDPVVELLAFHFHRSGDRPKTFEYSLKSGDKARSVFANDDAIRHYKRTGSLVPAVRPEPDVAASVATSLGDVYELTGRHNPAVASYSRALETCLGARISRSDPSRLKLGRVAQGRGATLRSRAADLCRKIGYVCDRQSDYTRALAWFEQSLEVAPDRGGNRGASYIGLAGILYRAGRYDEAERWAVKGLRSLAAAGASEGLAHAHNLMGVVNRDQGLVRKAIQHRLKALKMYEGLGHLTGQADTLNNLGLDYFSYGEWPEAVSRFESCLEIAERIGDTDLVAILKNNLGEVHLAQGDIEAARGELKWAAETAPRLGNLAVAGLADANMGEALTMEGHLPEARAMLRRSAKTLRRVGAQTLLMEAEVRLAELHFAAHDYYAAETLANTLLQASRKVDARPIEGRALRLLGQLAARRKNSKEAEELLRQSIALFADAGATHGEAKSRLALAKVTGDRDEARKALRAFRRLGAQRDAAKAEEVLG